MACIVARLCVGYRELPASAQFRSRCTGRTAAGVPTRRPRRLRSASRQRFYLDVVHSLAGAVLIDALAGGHRDVAMARPVQGQVNAGETGVPDTAASPRRIFICDRDRVVLCGTDFEFEPGSR